jgi:cobalt-zinc-cadmium efflux system protein
LHRHSHTDLNVRGAYLHMLGDAAVSLGVVIAGLTMRWTDWLWLDPVVSLAIVLVIMVTSWGLLRESMRLALAGVPAGIDRDEVESFLRAQPGVSNVHDLHVWAMSTTDTALTVHLIMPQGHPGDAFLGTLCQDLQARFRIAHPTIQIETGDQAHPCALTAAH